MVIQLQIWIPDHHCGIGDLMHAGLPVWNLLLTYFTLTFDATVAYGADVTQCASIPYRRRILWFTPSSAAASTTAMPCCTALQMANSSDCNQSRTQLRVWWLEPGALTTLHRFSSHFIGCRCDNDLEWPLIQISRSRYYSTSKNSKMVQDRGILTRRGSIRSLYDYGLSNGAIFNDLEWLINQFQLLKVTPLFDAK